MSPRTRKRESASTRSVRQQRQIDRSKDVLRVLTREPMTEVDISKAVTWGKDRSLLTRTLGWLCENKLVEEVVEDGPRRFKLGARLTKASVE